MRIFYISLFAPALAAIINLIFFLLKMPKTEYFLPLFGFLTVLINGFFFFFLVQQDRRLAYFLQSIAFFVQVLILIFFLLG